MQPQHQGGGQQGFAPVPMPMNQLGKPIEKFSTSSKTIFFSAAVVVLATGIIGLINAAEKHRAMKVVNQVYLITFGLLMCIVDMPEVGPSFRILKDFKDGVFKYLLFMTRFTGRGIAYMFLGSIVYTSMDHMDPYWLVCVLPTLWVFCIGVWAFAFGVLKTRSLEKLRQAILMREDEDFCPGNGLGKQELVQMANQIQGQRWDDEMCRYVLNALSLEIRADDRLSQKEFDNWLNEPLQALL